MRDILASLAGTTHRFHARPVRTGNDAYGALTLLLCDVTHWQGWHACDHAWVEVTPALRPACGVLGGVVQFRATVAPYQRDDGSRDFGLRDFTDVRVVRRA